MSYSYETPTEHRGGHNLDAEDHVRVMLSDDAAAVPLIEGYLLITRASLPSPYPLESDTIGWGVSIDGKVYTNDGLGSRDVLDKAYALLAIHGAMTTPAIRQQWDMLRIRIDEVVAEFGSEGETWDDLDTTTQRLVAHIVAERDKAFRDG